MFRKRVKKSFPPGTFIPMPARVCAILQLCLAFMILLWNFSQPFMGEIFAYKSQMLLYQDVMGISKPSDSDEKLTRLKRNLQRFEVLPSIEIDQLNQHYEELQELSRRTFIQKLWRSIHILMFEIPFYEQLWLLLSLVLPILLLKRVEGASQAIWLLPILTCIYSLDNISYAQSYKPSQESRLFPSEKILVNHYLKEALSPNLLEQKEQLLRAWNMYLIRDWSSHSPLKYGQKSNELLAEDGEFAFNVARIKSLPLPKEIIRGSQKESRENILVLSLYLFWNFFFATTVMKMNKNDTKTILNPLPQKYEDAYITIVKNGF